MSNLLNYGSSILQPPFPTSKPYLYKVEVPATGQIVSLATLKAHLNITTAADDALLSLYLDTATTYIERFTRRDYLVRTYSTLRDYWDYTNQYGNYFDDSENFLITKSPVNSIVSIQYLVSGVFTTLNSSIYYAIESDFTRISLADGKSYPTDKDSRLQSIKITFTAGYTTVPNDIINAAMNIVASLYADRGDCNCTDMDFGFRYVSGAARAILLQNRIERL